MKQIVAFIGSGISVILGLGLAVVSFIFAFAIQARLFLIIPCLAMAVLVPVFLIVIPRYFYLWCYDFPKVRQGNSPHLQRLRKSLPF